MDILSFKRWFEAALSPEAPQVDTAAAWQAYAAALEIYPEGEQCEEFSFGAGVQAWYDGARLVKNERVFQVYFGRLIDAAAGQSWRTAEINCYFNYEMDAEFQGLLEAQPLIDVEAAACLADGAGTLRDRREAFTAQVEGLAELWDMLRRHPVAAREIQFYIL